MPFNLYNPGIKWDVSQTKSVTVKRRGRRDERQNKGIQLLIRNSQENSNDSNERFATYTVVKPKSQARIINELLWQYNKMTQQHKGKYLAHMPHSSEQSNLPPLFPSWSVLCIGHSKLYVHKHGLSEQPGFLPRSEFLMPYDLNMTVKTHEWAKGMQDILRVDKLPFRERRNDENLVDKTHKEKLKVRYFAV